MTDAVASSQAIARATLTVRSYPLRQKKLKQDCFLGERSISVHFPARGNHRRQGRCCTRESAPSAIGKCVGREERCRLLRWRPGPRLGPRAAEAVGRGATAAELAASPSGGRARLSWPVPSQLLHGGRFRCAPRGRLLRWRRGPPPHLVAAGATCRLPHLPPLVRGSFLTFLSADSPF